MTSDRRLPEKHESKQKQISRAGVGSGQVENAGTYVHPSIIARQADYVMKFCVTRGHNGQKKEQSQIKKHNNQKIRVEEMGGK